MLTLQEKAEAPAVAGLLLLVVLKMAVFLII
jgi:hypothetical protein